MLLMLYITVMVYNYQIVSGTKRLFKQNVYLDPLPLLVNGIYLVYLK